MSTQEPVRLNKYLSEAGICSRREADRLIEAGRVLVNHIPAGLGTRVSETDEVEVDGKKASKVEEIIILAFHKPKGIVCTSEKREKNNIIDYLAYPKKLTYAGRLDKDSEGLMIMTNQGELVNRMMRAANEHEKEYVVTVDKEVTQEMIEKMAGGIWLPELGMQTRRCLVEKVGRQTFRIILTQGLNRQIRRMCEACGYRVFRLVRTRIMNVQLGNIPKGKYRSLTPEEVEELYNCLKDGKQNNEKNGVEHEQN